MRTFIIILLAVCWFGEMTAQNYVRITGQILEKGSNKPIAYANIGLPKYGVGTVSGQDGNFTLKVGKWYSEETFSVSFIGYKTYQRKVSDIKSPIVIYLSPTTNSLQEVVITSKNDAKEIVRTAIKKKKENYPKFSTNVLAFYREAMTDEDGEYEYLAEGVLKVHKDSYMKKDEGDTGLVQARMFNLKNPLDTTVDARFSSGHIAAHRFDIVKNREDFINSRFLKAYEYAIKYTTTYQDKPAWVISFKADEDYEPQDKKRPWWSYLTGTVKEPVKARMEGVLYIEQSNYAIIRAEFDITDEGLKKVSDYPLYSGNWDANSYVVNYQKVGKKWHFSSALREGIHNKGEQYTNEVIITENSGKRGKPIPYAKRMYRGSYFVRVTGEYNDDFWKNYNTAPLNDQLQESVRQMNNARKAAEVFAPEKVAAVQELRDSLALEEQVKALEAEKQREAKEEAERSVRQELPNFELQDVGRRNFDGVRFNFGLGSHFITTPATPLQISFLSGDVQETILSGAGEIEARDFEYVGFFDFDVHVGETFFIRFGQAGDFYNSIHKDTHVGLGVNLNLSQGRPVHLRVIAQHNRLRYARKLTQATNNFGSFEVNGKKYTAEKINLYYGSFTRNLKLTTELAVELRRNRAISIRGTYFLPIQTRQEVYFWERGQLFRRKEALPVSNARVAVQQNDGSFNERLIPKGHFMVTLGYSLY